MALDRTDADHQGIGDLAIGVAGGHQVCAPRLGCGKGDLVGDSPAKATELLRKGSIDPNHTSAGGRAKAPAADAG